MADAVNPGETSPNRFSAGSIGWSTDFTSITLYFRATLGTNDSIQIDAISNPEPGTLALFGLGIAGLGFAAVRRRKSIKARATKTV